MNKEKGGLWHNVGEFFRDKFNLDADKAAQSEVVESIRKSVEFRGPNLWILIFATFVASLGLNVNSTAVIIGAMLISPLMGPIMGIGLSLGINDFELMKRSLRNFGFMVLISIVTSTIYFIISPISTAQSELLARTSPTIYDVLIALFGGLAGIVAQSRTDKTSTVIPGVAIATALMPPLCTAGYGIATGQWAYFGGAAYLFFINTVFIALATYMIVRVLKYHPKQFVDKAREQKVKRYMFLIAVITLVPSVFMAYNIIQHSVFENAADRFVNTVFRFENTLVVNCEKNFGARGADSQIEVVLMGETLPDNVVENARAQMPSYGLHNVQLVVRQSDGSAFDFATLQQSYSDILHEKNSRISELEQTLATRFAETLPISDIAREAAAITDNVSNIAVSRQRRFDASGQIVDTMLVCVVRLENNGKPMDREKLEAWLRERTKTNTIRIYVE